jgi:protein ImuB
LETRGQGVRRADLIIYRVDNTLQSLRAGTAKPVRDIPRLTKLLCSSIENIDPGFGIEKLSLAATMIEPFEEKQSISSAGRRNRRRRHAAARQFRKSRPAYVPAGACRK